MGDAGGSGLSVVSASNWLCHRGKVLQDHEQVELAPACFTETDRRRSPPNESVESKGKHDSTLSTVF
jgi:hypothetical protein